MFHILKKELALPAIYEETKGEFWNDNHISMQMLKAHLNPSIDSASRNLQFIESSVKWIKTTMPAEQYPHLLDIGCGPGLYAARFAKAGYQVTGVDFSQRSIDYATKLAKKQGLDINYSYQNYLSLNIDKTFDIATMIYCDYGALSAANRKILLQKVYTQLKIGGKFVLDVFSLAAYDNFAEGRTWTMCPTGGFWRADSYIEMQHRCKYPPDVTLEQYNIISECDLKTYYIWNSYFSRESLTTEAKAIGFKVCELFGDVTGAAYDLDSLTLTLVLEKQ